MSQRISGYARQPDEAYPTPPWVTRAVLPHFLKTVVSVWEPAAGSGRMAETLRRAGYEVIATKKDFLTMTKAPPVDAIITNPPYGGGGRTAVKFIEHALKLHHGQIAMLLRVDFDSGKTRQHIFGDCARFYCKVVLLDRIMWFKGDVGPSYNHAWFIWMGKRQPWPAFLRWPIIKYAERV